MENQAQPAYEPIKTNFINIQTCVIMILVDNRSNTFQTGVFPPINLGPEN